MRGNRRRQRTGRRGRDVQRMSASYTPRDLKSAGGPGSQMMECMEAMSTAMCKRRRRPTATKAGADRATTRLKDACEGGTSSGRGTSSRQSLRSLTQKDDGVPRVDDNGEQEAALSHHSRIFR